MNTPEPLTKDQNLDLHETNTRDEANYNQIKEGQEIIKINQLNKDIVGSLETDIPLKIINAKILDDNDVNINCLVKWKPRSDGNAPEADWISSKILKTKCPMVLFDFYESRIKFPKKESK